MVTSASSFGRMGMSTTSGSSRKTKRGNRPGSPSGYRSCGNTFAQKIQSFKTLYGQATTMGTGKFNRPTPTTLNSFANWINKGAIVQMVSTAQVTRWAKATHKSFQSSTASPTSCKTILCAKFGKSTIKAVARTKSGSFIVATSPTISGKQFSFPK